ncbi:MAG: histone deacetylase family protein [Candidatus Latescibacteria bacterium]|nr:histone deacetylase family protein [Candidatus Latescibacterota bacterium]
MHIVYSDRHKRHDPPYEFVRDHMSPYSEAPARIERLRAALQKGGHTDFIEPRPYGPEPLNRVHDADYLHFIEHIFPAWVAAGRSSESIIPETFANQAMAARPDLLHRQPGYYCFDAQTPIVEHTWEVALTAAHAALTGADLLLEGHSSAYILCRPPGHHAGHALYGGYCYLNNAALAAAHLHSLGRIAVLDIDYHHGNGTQDIFYASDQVLVVSIHADPNRAYPFFSGYPSETGQGPGQGYNHNIALPPAIDDTAYLNALDGALERIQAFAPAALILSLGLDIYQGDPLGDFHVSLDAFGRIGTRISSLSLPTLIVQEGGYNIDEGGIALINLLSAFN